MDKAPLVRTAVVSVPASGAAVDFTQPAYVAVEDGVVTSVSYLPAADVTGAATNNRTISLVNKGTDGDGTTVVATKALTNGNNLNASDANALTLGVTANLAVSAGDVLAFASVHVGTGIADPGGLVAVEISRA